MLQLLNSLLVLLYYFLLMLRYAFYSVQVMNFNTKWNEFNVIHTQCQSIASSPSGFSPFAYSSGAHLCSYCQKWSSCSLWPLLLPRTFPTFEYPRRYFWWDYQSWHQDVDISYWVCGYDTEGILSCRCVNIFRCSRCRSDGGILWLCEYFWCRIGTRSSGILEIGPDV